MRMIRSFGQASSRAVAIASILSIVRALLPSEALLARRQPLDWRKCRHCCVDHIRFSGHGRLMQRPRRQGGNALNIAQQQLGEFEPINFAGIDDEVGRPINPDRRRVWLYDFVTPTKKQSTAPALRTIPYHEAWELQKSLVERQLSRIGNRPKDPPSYSQFVPSSLDYDNSEDGNLGANEKIPPHLWGCDSVVMLQHDPVYTLGTASDTSFIHGYHENGDSDSTIPIVRIERGGEVTYHGPGQLTVYPILDLRGYKKDIHWYMRALEEVILLALKKAGVKGATREDNLTGVWVSNKKIAALGIKARRWVTMHGLAINVDVRSLQNFSGIVPCGLKGRSVTCINDELNELHHFTIQDFTVYVREAFEEIFGISLVSPPT